MSKTYVRYATRAQKFNPDTTVAHTRAVLGGPFTKVKVGAVGTATYTLTFVFPDRTEITLDNTELSAGMELAWDIYELLITNTAQPATTGPKLLCDQQYLEE